MGRPTGAERREVAAKLRGIADRNGGYLGPARMRAALVAGQMATGTLGLEDCAAVLRRYADLIDRPECRMRYDAVHADFVCSACGCLFEYPSTFWHDKARGFRYCPSCGAEVVDGPRRSDEG